MSGLFPSKLPAVSSSSGTPVAVSNTSWGRWRVCRGGGRRTGAQAHGQQHVVTMRAHAPAASNARQSFPTGLLHERTGTTKLHALGIASWCRWRALLRRSTQAAGSCAMALSMREVTGRVRISSKCSTSRGARGRSARKSASGGKTTNGEANAPTIKTRRGSGTHRAGSRRRNAPRRSGLRQTRNQPAKARCGDATLACICCSHQLWARRPAAAEPIFSRVQTHRLRRRRTRSWRPAGG